MKFQTKIIRLCKGSLTKIHMREGVFEKSGNRGITEGGWDDSLKFSQFVEGFHTFKSNFQQLN